MLPSDNAQRKLIRAFQGFVKYFPDAIAACANLSRIANEQHNPGEPMHWAKEKSTDELDSLMNHLLDIASKGPESRDADGVLDAVKVFWRAGANLQRLADSGVDVLGLGPSMKYELPAQSTPAGGVDDYLIGADSEVKTATEIRMSSDDRELNPTRADAVFDELILGGLITKVDGRLSGPHEPTMREFIDLEQQGHVENILTPDGVNHDGPWDVVFTVRMEDGTARKIATRGPYETIEQAKDYARRNPEALLGTKSIHPSRQKVRDDA